MERIPLTPELSQRTTLNLGCSTFPIEGALNVDVRPEAKADVFLDFSHPEALLGLPNGHYERILLFHVLEHVSDPHGMIRVLKRLLRPGGTLHIRVPHASRGFTNAEHKRGFDVGFPHYFNPKLSEFFYGTELELVSMRMDWAIRFDIYAAVIPMWQVYILRVLNAVFTPLANLSPGLCSRLWCFWVGGFEQIEFIFRKPANGTDTTPITAGATGIEAAAR